MKTFSSLSFLATLAAFAAGAQVEVVVSAVFAAGLVAFAAFDYGRRPRPLRLPARRQRRTLQAQFRPPALGVESNRLAA